MYGNAKGKLRMEVENRKKKFNDHLYPLTYTPLQIRTYARMMIHAGAHSTVSIHAHGISSSVVNANTPSKPYFCRVMGGTKSITQQK